MAGTKHFFDPINNQGLFWEAEAGPLGYIFRGFPNRDWAMGIGPDGTEYDNCGTGDHFDSDTCNDYSWHRAKQSFYEALLSPAEQTRNEHFVLFCERLGRVLHLLQDVSVPSHTRNDLRAHLDWVSDGYEHLVRTHPGIVTRDHPGLVIPDFRIIWDVVTSSAYCLTTGWGWFRLAWRGYGDVVTSSAYCLTTSREIITLTPCHAKPA